MYAFLLLLGAVITGAGLALVASGVSIQEHTFDATNVTPGTVAVIGGCVLIGLAFVVRALLRVERALSARPMPRPVRADEAASSTAQAGEAPRASFPPKPNPVPNPQPLPIPAIVRPAADAAVEPARPPVLEKLENAPLVEESDVSLLPKAPARADEENGAVNHSVVARIDGAARAKSDARNGVGGRPMRGTPNAKNSIFDSLWPRTQQSTAEAYALPETRTAPPPLPPPPPPAPPPQPAQDSELPSPAQSAAPVKETPAPVSILKSGVVEGMAYTLYSDGSIEAQLPGGTLRFGSITELRNHIEQNG
jgi:hypothetical protein